MNTTPAEFTLTATPAGAKGTRYTVTKDGKVWDTRTSKREYRAIAVAYSTTPRWKAGQFDTNVSEWSLVGYAGTPELATKALKAHQGRWAKAAAERAEYTREVWAVHHAYVVATLED